MSDIQDLIDALPKLTQEQLRDLRGRISALLSLGGGVPPPVRDDNLSRMVLETVCDVVQARGVEAVNVAMLERSSIARDFQDKCEGVARLLGLDQFQRTERRAVLRVCVDLLFDYLARGVPVRWDKVEERLVRAPLPVGSRELMIFVHMIPVVVDHAFPGYVRSGLFHLVARRLTRDRLGGQQ